MIKLLRMLNVSSCVEDSCRCSLRHLQAEHNLQLDIDHELGFWINAKWTSQEERSQRLEIINEALKFMSITGQHALASLPLNKQ
jgi:hypothetical protein